MPIVSIPSNMLAERLGEPRLGTPELVQLLQRLGCDVDGYETVHQLRCLRCGAVLETLVGSERPGRCEGCGQELSGEGAQVETVGEVEVVRIDLLPVRPDMLDPGGLARALRFFLRRAVGPAAYACAPPRITVQVDPAMAERSSYRPAIACAVLRGLPLTEELIPVVMKLQENLHWAMGRDRKLASIGVYDLATLRGETFRFRPVGPDELRFVPLMCDPSDPASLMTPKDILTRHPKGVAYAHLLAGHQRYPLLEDGQGGVLSLPPIINSEATKVTANTRDLFVDVTGLSERLVQKALAVTVTSLLELGPSARLEQVRLVFADREVVTPDLSPELHELDPQRAERLIGLPLDADRVRDLLQKMGHGVRSGPGGRLLVEVPAYRNDVMHEVDLIEDVAMGHGYHEVPPTLVKTLTVGQARPIEELSNRARQVLTGLGLLEVVTLPLSSPEASYDRLNLPRSDRGVTIANPVSVEQTMLRTSLLPGLLSTLAANIHRELPHRIFEVGDVTFLEPAAETGAAETRRVAIALVGARVSVADAWSVAEVLLRELGQELVVVAEDHEGGGGWWMPGRVARIEVGGAPKGILGEVHPEVLERFGIRAATALVEMELDLFADRTKTS